MKKPETRRAASPRPRAVRAVAKHGEAAVHARRSQVAHDLLARPPRNTRRPVARLVRMLALSPARGQTSVQPPPVGRGHHQHLRWPHRDPNQQRSSPIGWRPNRRLVSGLLRPGDGHRKFHMPASTMIRGQPLLASKPWRALTAFSWTAANRQSRLIVRPVKPMAILQTASAAGRAIADEVVLAIPTSATPSAPGRPQPPR